jgi:hypothetical protein
MFIQTQNCRELRVVLHEPSLKMKELWGVRNGLAKPGVQPILSKAICSVHLCVRSFDDVQRVGMRSQMCACRAREISSTLILVPIWVNKENKKKQTRALLVEILGSLNFIIIITFLIIYYYYYYYYFLFYVFTQLFII